MRLRTTRRCPAEEACQAVCCRGAYAAFRHASAAPTGTHRPDTTPVGPNANFVLAACGIRDKSCSLSSAGTNTSATSASRHPLTSTRQAPWPYYSTCTQPIQRGAQSHWAAPGSIAAQASPAPIFTRPFGVGPGENRERLPPVPKSRQRFDGRMPGGKTWERCGSGPWAAEISAQDRAWNACPDREVYLATYAQCVQ
jgi:hypothetical protein